MLGRLVNVVASQQQPTFKKLLWETPLAIALGVVGRGLGDILGLTGFPAFAFIIAVAYIGPRALDIYVDKMAEKYGLRGILKADAKPTKPADSDSAK